MVGVADAVAVGIEDGVAFGRRLDADEGAVVGADQEMAAD
jgi:hypothetical protein